jgi:hypothetical protein
VEAITADSRQGTPDQDLTMKQMIITDDTDVRDRAEDIDDKKYRNWNANHINETLKEIIGGAQFTTHTDLWATEQKGIMPLLTSVG